MIKKFSVTVLLILFTLSIQAQLWSPKKAKLMTRFANDVNPANVLPEYPRPQMVRSQWMNLNGLWQFDAAANAQDRKPKGKLSRSILVPFPVESALSGVMEHHEGLWYRRTFTFSAAWKGQDVLLHFGAVDYEAEVFINGKSLGVHSGGYDPFTYNITPHLTSGGEQELMVRVYDPTDNKGYPRGKQTLKPGGIMYTSVTGIWQTVWLEPVPKSGISELKMVPDVDHSLLQLTVSTNGSSSPLIVKIKDGDKVVKTFAGISNKELSIPLPGAKLWSPDAPFLYDLEISLLKGSTPTDKVGSYFGMRKISIAEEGGFKKLFLNNKFLFQIGPLDQGFWPDGGYTAPTDAALKYDLEMIKGFGYNMVRKHIKVESYRWYYWADKLGLMVWQDMPSPNSYTDAPQPLDTAAFARQLTRMVQTHWNSPSIVMWVVFNEAQGQHNTAGLVQLVRTLDTTRIINEASGWQHTGAGDVLDVHSYPPPGVGISTTQVLACGEYGGIGYVVPGHTWAEQPTYVFIKSEKELLDLYDSFANDLTVFKTNKGLSAAVYTEITDVEAELNGLLTYDRAIIKADPAKLSLSNKKVISKDLYLTELLATAEKVSSTWSYTFTKPESDNWFAQNFDASTWKTGEAGFGTRGTPGAQVRTVWSTADIWIRKEFTLEAMPSSKMENIVLNLHHDEDCEVYINGVKVAAITGYTGGYSTIPLSDAGKAALRFGAQNTIAIHCHQTRGGQYIDAGLSIISADKPDKK